MDAGCYERVISMYFVGFLLLFLVCFAVIWYKLEDLRDRIDRRNGEDG